MQFLIIGKDGKDRNALSRRMKVRHAHLELGNKMEASGNRWYGCAILDSKNKMIGSMSVMDFPSKKHLDKYLKQEPYIKGKVWKKIEVYPCDIKNPWKFNKPKSFFKGKL